jgi:uncharacterized protein (DUF302 family)
MYLLLLEYPMRCISFAKSFFASLTIGLTSTAWAQADGLVTLASPHSAAVTMGRLEAVVKERGLNVFARIDHAAGAAKIGKTLRPTELLIFGNPQGGTPLMECAQTAGIDLPLKALVWEDAAGKTMLSYNAPDFLAKRHGAPAVLSNPGMSLKQSKATEAQFTG